MAKRSSNAKTKRAVATKKKRRPPIRLACVSCDRDDYDGVWRLPKDWADVSREQTLADSLREVAEGDSSRSVFDWHTHTGYCPECQQAES